MYWRRMGGRGSVRAAGGETITPLFEGWAATLDGCLSSPLEDIVLFEWTVEGPLLDASGEVVQDAVVFGQRQDCCVHFGI